MNNKADPSQSLGVPSGLSVEQARKKLLTTAAAEGCDCDRCIKERVQVDALIAAVRADPPVVSLAPQGQEKKEGQLP